MKGGFFELGEFFLILQQFDSFLGHIFHISYGEYESILIIFNKFMQSACICGYHGGMRCHGFESGESKAFFFAGGEKDIGHMEYFFYGVYFSQQGYFFLQFFLSDKGFDMSSFGSIANEHQFCGADFLHFFKDADNVLYTFDGSKVGNMDEEFFFFSAKSVSIFWLRLLKLLDIDKIMNDMDVFTGMKMCKGFFFQCMGYRSNGIGLVDRKLDNRV